ncbi:DUF5131 family protein [Ancylobacter moscoviensis]
MADRSGIEWTDATWNPIVGCSVVSPGCTNCYAMAQAARIERMQPGSHYAGTTQPSKAGAVWTGKMALAPEHILTQPLRWRRQRRIFVNSMGDLFHESVPDAWIDRVFAVMALTPQHTYQVLTKRSARMREYLGDPDAHTRIAREVCDMVFEHLLNVILLAAAYLEPHAPPGKRIHLYRWPLPNVWLGVSTEDQRRANERVPDLLATPAAIRFVSAEPLLGSLNLRRIRIAPDHHTMLDALDGYAITDSIAGSGAERAKLNLAIVGGESGPAARPMHPDWARSLRDQCAAAGTAFFFKQWGSWEVAVDRESDDPDWRLDYHRKLVDGGDTKWLNLAGGCGFHGERFHVMRRVGKLNSGRLLDGVEHNAMPEVRA